MPSSGVSYLFKVSANGATHLIRTYAEEIPKPLKKGLSGSLLFKEG
jgi:hypothetical protein